MTAASAALIRSSHPQVVARRFRGEPISRSVAPSPVSSRIATGDGGHGRKERRTAFKAPRRRNRGERRTPKPGQGPDPQPGGEQVQGVERHVQGALPPGAFDGVPGEAEGRQGPSDQPRRKRRADRGASAEARRRGASLCVRRRAARRGSLRAVDARSAGSSAEARSPAIPATPRA